MVEELKGLPWLIADLKPRIPCQRHSSLASNAAFAQGVEDDNAADGEGYDGGQRGDQHERCVQVKEIGEDGCDSEDDAEEVGPKGTAS